MPFQRPGRSTYYMDIRTPSGSVRRSLGTDNKATAKRIEAEIQRFIGKREWDLVNAVIDERLSLGELYDASHSHQLEAVRARLNDIDLEPLVEEWAALMARKVKPDTVAHYLHAVRSLIVPGKPYLRSDFTTAKLAGWIASYPGSSGTRRKASAAMKQFEKFLIRQHGLTHKPMDNVEIPRPGAPRTR